jgi:transcriptional regulator with XRE-family HTH domain
LNTQSSLAEQLLDKQYRDAYVASQIRISLPMQCRALRESREWTQPQLAEAAGMSQPRISEIERPGERRLNLETLLRLASAFDVALQVRFVPFSKFVDDDDSVQLDNFYIRPYLEDISHLKKLEEEMKDVIQFAPQAAIQLALIGSELQPADGKWNAQQAANTSPQPATGEGTEAQIKRKYSGNFSDIAS